MPTWKSASILCRARRGDTSAMLRLASCRLLLLLLQPITAQYCVWTNERSVLCVDQSQTSIAICQPITVQYSVPTCCSCPRSRGCGLRRRGHLQETPWQPPSTQQGTPWHQPSPAPAQPVVRKFIDNC